MLESRITFDYNRQKNKIFPIKLFLITIIDFQFYCLLSKKKKPEENERFFDQRCESDFAPNEFENKNYCNQHNKTCIWIFIVFLNTEFQEFIKKSFYP